jgi:hypothetical protein
MASTLCPTTNTCSSNGSVCKPDTEVTSEEVPNIMFNPDSGFGTLILGQEKFICNGVWEDSTQCESKGNFQTIYRCMDPMETTWGDRGFLNQKN